MPVSLLVITHDNIGAALIDTASSMLGVRPLHIDVISVGKESNPDTVVSDAEELIKNHDGTLVLTDMYGSTPSNIACRLRSNHNVRVVGGVNLPMLVRVLNYPGLGLDELVVKAVSGGKDGVMSCNREHDH